MKRHVFTAAALVLLGACAPSKTKQPAPVTPKDSVPSTGLGAVSVPTLLAAAMGTTSFA